MRKYLPLFFTFFFIVHVNAQSSIGLTSITPTVTGQQDIQFVIDVKVGDPNAVNNLSGVSFNLEWNNTTYIESVSTTVGTFLGSDPLIIAQNFNNRIEVGVTSTTGGKNGSGVIASCTLKVKQTVSSDVIVAFSLTNISAIDGNGSSLTLTPFSDLLNIILMKPDGISDNIIPNDVMLSQNYPNPFNPITTIDYSINKASNVQLKLFNSLGEEMTLLVDEFQYPGSYSVKLEMEKISSGVYYYKLITEDFTATKKMILIK